MSKINQILLICFLGQIALIAGMQMTEDNQQAIKPSKVFTNLDLKTATKVEIKAPLNQSTKHDNEFVLSKEGEQWRLNDAENYPADNAKLKQLLENISRIKSGQLVTSSANYHNKLKVADDNYERKLSVWVGEESRSFYLGTANGRERCHFRLEGSPDVYLAEGLLPWDVYDVSSGWVDAQIFTASTDDIWGIRVAVAGKPPVSIKRSPEGSWTVDGQTEPPNPTKLNAMLNKASNIVIDYPVGKIQKPEYGFNSPTTVIEIVTGTSSTTGIAPKSYSTHKVTLGAEKIIASNQSYFARVSGSEWIATVPSWALTKLTDVSSEDLVTK